MPYTPPELPDLVLPIQNLLAEYHRRRPGPTKDKEDREKSIAILMAVDTFIKPLILAHDKPDATFRRLMVGAWFAVVIAHIGKTCWTNPAARDGYVWRSGSELYALGLEVLRITPDSKVDPTEQLKLMSEFFHYAFVEQEHAFASACRQHRLDVAEVKARVMAAMAPVIAHLSGTIESMMRSVPTEPAMDENLKTVKTRYEAESKAKDRLFWAELLAVLPQIIPAAERPLEGMLTQTQRIKMALMLYVLRHDIETDFWWKRRSSVLRKLCCETLNIKSSDDISPDLLIVCLSELQIFLQDSKVITQFEAALRGSASADKKYLARTFLDIRVESEKMIMAILEKNNWVSPATWKIAAMCGFVLSIPGSALGSTVGHLLMQTDALHPPIDFLRPYASAVMSRIVCGGEGLGYHTSTPLVQNTLNQALARTCESVSRLLGAALGFAVGVIVVDGSYATLTALCKLHQHLTKIKPELAQDIESETIDCFLKLPPEIFSEEKKEHLRKITERGEMAAGAAGCTVERVVGRDNLFPLIPPAVAVEAPAVAALPSAPPPDVAESDAAAGLGRFGRFGS